jgi:carboxypeptidase C (cathepsin A)
MSLDENLKVLIVHGVFDLVTPYFGSVLVVRQMALDPEIRSNLNLKVYEGGHMFYTHPNGRTHFFEDARQFFRSALP